MNLDTRLKSYLNKIIPIPDLEIEKIQAIFSQRKILKNEMFLQAGEHLTHIAFNINGVFRYFYNDFEGNDITKYFITDNDFILSLTSFIEKSPSLFSIEALEDSQILIAPVDVIYHMMENNIYLQIIYKHILEKTYIEKEKREAEFLLHSAKDRYINFINENHTVHSKIKLFYIASYLGIAPESLSRIRRQIGNLNKCQ